MEKELIDFAVAEVTKMFKEISLKEGAQSRISYNNNIFGGRIKSARGTTEIDIIFNDDIIIHASGGLISCHRDLNLVCQTKDELNEKLLEIKDFTNKCFGLKLIKKH